MDAAAAGPSWITISLLVINILIGIILGLIGFLMSKWYAKLDNVAQQFIDFQLNVTRNTVPRDAFEKHGDYIRLRVHGLADRMFGMEGRISAVEGAFRVMHKIDWPITDTPKPPPA